MSERSNPIIRRLLTVAIPIIVIGALVIPKVLPSGDGEQQTGAQAAPTASTAAAGMAVSAVIVEPRPLRDNIVATGTIRANEEVELQSEVSGKITSIEFVEGSRVSQGDLLVKINDAELQAQLRQAEYRERLAAEREQRQKQILDRGGISLEQYEQTLNELNIIRAEIDLVQAQIEKTEIRAPFDGTIGLRYVSEGSLISQNSRIATLQNLDQIKIDFFVPERYAGRLQEGSRLQFGVQGSSDQYEGRVYAIEPRIQEDTRSLQLRAIAPNPGTTLIPGAFAQIELTLDEIDSALMIPSLALIPEADERYVYVLEDGRAARRTVETGVRTATSIQVIDGLISQDTVLTSGLQQLRPGMSVRVLGLEN